MDPVLLDTGWWLRSSAETGDGERLSRAGVDNAGWHAARLPATVVGALVEAGVYEDPFFATNFRKIPGQGPPHENFSNHPFPEGSPFSVPWWFRRELELEPLRQGEQLWLRFDGINYRAALWLNGQRVAGPDTLVGAYRRFDLCVTPHVHSGKNALALEVTPPATNDLAVTWVDWNPSPPDKNAGLWRRAWVRRTGPLALFDPHVVSRLVGASAELSVHVDVENPTDTAQRGELCFTLLGQSFRREVELPARTRQRISVAASESPALRVESPRLWWPRRMGEQALHELRVELFAGGELSDRSSIRFGIREVTSELVEGDAAMFRVNGRPILIRGGGWAGDVFQRSDERREQHQYEYVKHLGLNTIRFEGMLQDRAFLERCDEDGLLVIAGFCCCDHWEKWDNWKSEDYDVAAESLRSEIRRVRHHPSLVSWWYGSDFPPPREVEERYLAVCDEEHWPNPTHSSAAAKPTELTGPSGMKMAGPYDYVPPSYWLSDSTRGGAFGFATEISPGPAIPPVESLRTMLGEAHLWPQDAVWTLHAGGGPFKSLEIHDTALARRYGAPKDLEDYVWKAQLSAYEGERAMFEAYSQRKYRATGVVQWMLNNAWPSLIWHLWDWYLRPAGGYFGTKKACESLHVQYSDEGRAVLVVSELWQPEPGLEVRARLFDLAGGELWAERATVDVGPDAVVHALTLPALDRSNAFLRLELRRGAELVSSNFYWLSSKPDTLDHEKGTWFTTPQLEFADHSALASLPAARVSAHVRVARKSDDELALAIELVNDASTLAFFTRLRLLQGDEEVLPVFWSDNFVSLLPGETLTLEARIPRAELADERALRLELSGYNSERALCAL
ncbi:MAG TPA: hypothetical protein VM686_28315 [Polyangiaceae bacterium]|nr:hypothetical protein [Polyangiaceae bacterium]